MRVKLEEVCKRIYSGGDVPKDRYSEEKTEDYKVPIFANAEKDEGLYGYTDEAREKELSITVAARGTIGYTVIRREPFLPVVRLITVVPDLEKVSERYLFYALKMCKPQSSGTSIPQLTVPDIKKNTLNLLDIAEQESIANRLDKLNGIIKLRTEEISKMDELIRARFVEMFEGRGKVVLLTNYVWFQEGPGVISVDFAVEGTNLLTGSNINDNELSFGYKSDRFISNELANGKYAHFMCDKDDILVVSSAIAPEKFDQKVVIVEEDKKYCLNTGIIRFKPNREVMTLGYFREFLKTDYFKHQVMAEMRGIAQMHFGPSHLKQMTILLPESMEQQIEFEKFITQVNKSKLLAASQLQIHIYKTLTLL